MRLPRISAAKAVRVLERSGFLLDRSSGSHRMYRHPDGRRSVVPYHSGQVLSPRATLGLIADLRVSLEEFRKIL